MPSPTTSSDVFTTQYTLTNCSIIDFPESAIQPSTFTTGSGQTITSYPQKQFLFPALNSLEDCGKEISILKLNGISSNSYLSSITYDTYVPDTSYPITTYSPFTIQANEKTTSIFPIVYTNDSFGDCLGGNYQATTSVPCFFMEHYIYSVKFISIYNSNTNVYAWIQIG